MGNPRELRKQVKRDAPKEIAPKKMRLQFVPPPYRTNRLVIRPVPLAGSLTTSSHRDLSSY